MAGQELVESPHIAKLADFIDKNAPRIEQSMPVGVRATLVTKSLMSMMRQDPGVAACSVGSLITCLEQMVATGLDVSKGVMGKAYIIPYGKEAQFQLGYKGIKELVRRSGEGQVIMDAVREGDEFTPGSAFALPVHVPSADAKRHEKKLTHVYAAYIPKSGIPVVEIWSRERCISHRNHYSKGYRNAKTKSAHPWHETNPGFAVMCMKCPVMYLAGRGDLPLSPDVASMIATAEEFQAGTIDTVAVPQIEQGQPPQIESATQTAENDDRDRVDPAWVEEKLNKITTNIQLDKAVAEWKETFHADDHLLIDELATEHRELINGAE